MRIAQITNYFNPKYCLSNEHTLCRGLAKLGHEVFLFAADKPHRKIYSMPKKKSLDKAVIRKSKIERIDGFYVIRLHTGPEIGFVPLTPTLLATLLRMKFDIIHTHDYCTANSLYSAIVSGVKRVPLILTQHSDSLPNSVTRVFLNLLDGYTVGHYIFFQAKKLIALSTESKSFLKFLGADDKKIEIVPNAVDTEFYSPKKKNLLEEKWGISRPAILFVGRLAKEKGIAYLLQAFSRISKEIPDAKLVIVGTGPEESSLKNLKKKLRVDDVFFLGAIQNKYMPNIYVGSDVVVLPSFHEPFGNPVIEAMAAGKPVIGSYVGGMKDTIINGVTGFHTQPGNSNQIYKCVSKILMDDSLREKMGYKSRQRATEKYSEKKISKKIENIYFNAIENA